MNAFQRHAQELRDTWQVRALVTTQREGLGQVVLSMLAHTYDDALAVLLRVAFPGFESIAAPFIASPAKVDKTGAVVADVQLGGDTRPAKDQVIFASVEHMQSTFRRLADRMRLSDDDRIEMFKVAQRWVVADRRLDPTFDPRDPDAKRLVH